MKKAVKSMKRIKKLSVMLLCCLLLSVIAMPVSASAAKLNKKSISLNVGKIYTLKASGTKEKITWTSSKKSVATVSSKGVVKAVGNGTATITVKAKDGSGKKATCKITVKAQGSTSVKTDPSTYFKTVELNLENISQYFTFEVVDTYDSIWGDHTGARTYLRAKPLSDWYLFSTTGLGIEANFSIDCIDDDGNKYTYAAKSSMVHRFNCKEKGYDINSAMFKPTRVKGQLIFIKKEAVTSIRYKYDETIKRNRVLDCKVIKELDDYVMDNYATLGISYFGFDNILQPFELN